MIGQLFEVGPSSTTNPPNSALTNIGSIQDGVQPLLSQVSPSGLNLLVLSYQTSPEEWLQKWQKHAKTLPQELGFIQIGETSRGSGTIEGPTLKRDSPSLVEILDNPANLTGLKEHIRGYLDRWTNNGHRTIVYLDSLGPLLQSVGLIETHQFLHTLTNRIRTVDGYGYYLIQSKTDYPEIVNLLLELTDNHVDFEDTSARAVHP